MDLSDVETMDAFRRGGRDETTVTLLPDPDPRPVLNTLFSVDDHIVEPPDMFEGRMPQALADRAPRVVEEDDGRQMWHFDDRVFPNVGMNAVVGRPLEEQSMEPTRFDEMRRGAWDVHERIRDMDINGIHSSVNFPSLLAGFCGQKFSDAKDPELGLASMRAWNRWHFEEWTGSYPDRLVPLQIPWLNDADIAAAEIYKNAELGFRAVSFCELPTKIGRPSLHTGYWDPFIRACEETETVICLHVGSSSTTQTTSDDAPPETIPALFPVNSMFAAVDWLFSKIPLRFPDVRIMLSEGGIGWVPAMIDRLDHIQKHHGYLDMWKTLDLRPSEVLKRNFWFCAIDDPSGLKLYETIGVDNITLESDYPHSDSTWPDTQELLAEQLAALPQDARDKVTHQNASALFRHELRPVPSLSGRGPGQHA